MEPNRNNSPNGNKPGDPKRPQGSIWIKVVLAVAIALVIGGIYNMIVGSQYEEVTYSDFRQAFLTNQLAEVELQHDRILYLTKEEAIIELWRFRSVFPKAITQSREIDISEFIIRPDEESEKSGQKDDKQ